MGLWVSGPQFRSGATDLVGRWVYVGSTSGRVYALDLQEGCVYWTFDAGQEVRTAITIAPIPRVERGNSQYAAFFVDRGGTVYSVNPITGELRWKRRVGEPYGSATGTPSVYGGRIFVPLTGGGEGPRGLQGSWSAGRARYRRAGQQLWIASTLAEPQQVVDHDEQGRANLRA